MRILKILGVLLLGLSLAGCLTGGRRGGDSATTAYDLGLPPAVAAGETAWQLEVRAPAWLDGSAMIYRLAYARCRAVARIQPGALGRAAGRAA